MALAAVAEGKSREAAAAIGLMDRQTLRDWVHRFNAEGPGGLIARKSPGRPAKLSAAQKEDLRKWVEAGPETERPDLVRWRRADLADLLKERFDVECHETTVGRMLRGFGFSHISARARHPEKDDDAQEAFKKNFGERVAALTKELRPGTPVEIWFQDEARVGHKNGLVYQWARRGSRPRQPQDQRYESA